MLKIVVSENIKEKNKMNPTNEDFPTYAKVTKVTKVTKAIDDSYAPNGINRINVKVDNNQKTNLRKPLETNIMKEVEDKKDDVLKREKERREKEDEDSEKQKETITAEQYQQRKDDMMQDAWFKVVLKIKDKEILKNKIKQIKTNEPYLAKQQQVLKETFINCRKYDLKMDKIDCKKINVDNMWLKNWEINEVKTDMIIIKFYDTQSIRNLMTHSKKMDKNCPIELTDYIPHQMIPENLIYGHMNYLLRKKGFIVNQYIGKKKWN